MSNVYSPHDAAPLPPSPVAPNNYHFYSCQISDTETSGSNTNTVISKSTDIVSTDLFSDKQQNQFELTSALKGCSKLNCHQKDKRFSKILQNHRTVICWDYNTIPISWIDNDW